MRKTGLMAIGVAAFALGAYAVAAGDASTIATYTGCLKNGRLESVAVGDAPLAPCSAGETPMRLSGGDVTSVAAGPGLIGGGDTDAVTLEVDRSAVQSRVVGSCERDRLGAIDASIRAIHPDGSVSCNPDDAAPGTDVVAGFHDGPVWLPVNDTHAPEPIARLPVTPGKYLVTATLDLETASIGRIYTTCELRAGTDLDRTTLGLAGLLNQGGQHSSRIALQVVHEFTDPADVVMACAATYGARWRFLKTAATRVSGLTNAPLELVAP
jgi:hypothetical protein